MCVYLYIHQRARDASMESVILIYSDYIPFKKKKDIQRLPGQMRSRCMPVSYVYI
jgi:hypothetical protein